MGPDQALPPSTFFIVSMPSRLTKASLTMSATAFGDSLLRSMDLPVAEVSLVAEEEVQSRAARASRKVVPGSRAFFPEFKGLFSTAVQQGIVVRRVGFVKTRQIACEDINVGGFVFAHDHLVQSL